MNIDIASPVAIYTRYSTDKQNENSCEDQEAVCRDFLESRGYVGPIEVFQDAGISGELLVTRPGMLALIDGVKRGKFKTVLAESMSRLSRLTGDQTNFQHDCEARGIALLTPTAEIDAVTALAGGFADTHLRKQVKIQTKRGLLAVLRDNRIPYKAPYGYRARPERGKGVFDIDPEQSKIVVRIFKMYADGISPIRIATTLNHEGAPGPNGGVWNVTAINGNVVYGDGVLCNTTYIGHVIYPKRKMITDRDTGKRHAAPVPEADRRHYHFPDMRIVDAALFEEVQARRREIGGIEKPVYRRRPKRLLSGLLQCSCGGVMTVAAKDYYMCSLAKRSGACGNRQTIRAPNLDARVLAGVQRFLLSPERIRIALSEHEKAQHKLRAVSEATRSQARRRLTDVDRQLRNLEEMVADIGWSESTKKLMLALRQKKDEAEATLDAGGEAQAEAADPCALQHYRQRVTDLQATLGVDTADPELVAAVRKLIGKVVLTPTSSAGWNVDVVGLMNSFLFVSASKTTKAPRVSSGGFHLSDDALAGKTKMGAGAGFEPTTFRL